MKLAIKNIKFIDSIESLRNIDINILSNQDLRWVESVNSSYMFFSNAASGDISPNNRISTGFWLQDKNVLKCNYFYIVEDEYDFSNNNATDISSIKNWEEYYKKNPGNFDNFKNFRNILYDYYNNILSSNWDSLNIADKKILAKYYLVDKSKRESQYNISDLKIFWEELIYNFTRDNISEKSQDILNTIEDDPIENINNELEYETSAEIYLEDYVYGSIESSRETTSDWKHIMRLPINIKSGAYRINWYSRLTSSRNNRNIQAKILLNSNKIAFTSSKIKKDEDIIFSGFYTIYLPEGSHNIDFNFGSGDNNWGFGNTMIRAENIRIEIFKISKDIKNSGIEY